MLIKTSIIVPIFNEGENIEKAVGTLLSTVTDSANVGGFELLLINDGSQDDSWDKIVSISALYSNIRGINLTRNFGQTQAYKAGIDNARGEYIIFYSADMESTPSTIISVIKKLEEGYDFVNTNRVNRWSGKKSLLSRVANFLINKISKINIHDRGSGTKGMQHYIAKNLLIFGEMHRFIPDYVSIYTNKIIEIDTDFSERLHGVSSYNKRFKTVSVILDIVTLYFILGTFRKPYLLQPGRIFGIGGMGIFFSGKILFTYFIIQKIFFSASLAERPLFLISIMLIILGALMIVFIVLAELLLRIYFSISTNKQYIIK